MGGSQFAAVEGLVTEPPAFTPFAFFFIWMTNHREKCMRAKSVLEFGAVYMYTCPTRAPLTIAAQSSLLHSWTSVFYMH